MAIPLPGRDELPDGPRREFVVALHDLYDRAGQPAARLIAGDISRLPDRFESVSHQTISTVLRGGQVPPWERVRAIVRALAVRAELDVQEWELLAEFQRRWVAARRVVSESELLEPVGRWPGSRTSPAGPVVDTVTGVRLGAGHEEYLEWMRAGLEAFPDSPVVLYGPAGAGKTKLAREFVRRFQHRYAFTWWVEASSVARARGALLVLADQLDVREGRSDAEAVEWLIASLLPSRGWRYLMVFDGVDEEGVRRLIPPAGGHVIVTTRDAALVGVGTSSGIEVTAPPRVVTSAVPGPGGSSSVGAPGESVSGSAGSPAAPHRHLVGQMPTRVPRLAELSLIVRVATAPDAFADAVAASLPDLDGGARVTVVVQAPRGLVPLGQLEQTLLVPHSGDSEPVRFAFRAREIGPHRVQVTAWAGGTFLAELTLEVSVDVGGPSVDGRPRGVPIGPPQAEPGEVTLQVRFDGERYTFQLLSEPYLFEPVLAEALTAHPTRAAERAIATLRAMAAGQSGYTGTNARRWMRQTGIGLWNDLVPDLIKEQFWQLRLGIASFTIASGRDVIPWELLYPLSTVVDDGFLVEQFPVMRRVYGQQRFREVAAGGARFVLPNGSPVNAADEVKAIRRALGARGAAPSVVAELGALLDLIESGEAGLMHFACHNTFTSDGAGSAIAMSGGPFVPALLNSAVTRRTLAHSHPLVFINACRSAGAVPEYTRMMGWAQQFMAAGAGAFVGTLWAVESDAARTFAEVFYQSLARGGSLGDATQAARANASHATTDATWLAYTVYGDPTATATIH